MKPTRRAVLRKTLTISAACAAVLTLPGLELYFANSDQFALGTMTACALTLAAFVLTAAVFYLLLLAAKKCRIFFAATAALTALAPAMLLQYRLWSDNFPNDMPEDTLAGILLLAGLHVLVFLLPIIPALVWRRKLYRYTGKIALVFLLVQTSSAVLPLLNRPRDTADYDFREYSLDESGKFTFGRGDNIILLVVDCMSERLAEQAFRRYPELRTILKDFTVFDNMTSPLPETRYAVPAMLTGVEFPANPDGTPAQADHAEYLSRACRAPTSFFVVLKRLGFRTEGYPYILQTVSYHPDVLDNSAPISSAIQKESAIKILDTVLQKFVPFYLRPLVEEYYCIATDPFVPVLERGKQPVPNETYDQVFFRRLNGEFAVGKAEKMFKYLHLHGAHTALRTGEALEPLPQTTHLKQLRGSLKNLELLIAKLKQAGLYDRAMLVVTGDHTESYTPEAITFIKRPGEQHDAPVWNGLPAQIRDINSTVLAEVEPAYAEKSLFARPPRSGDPNKARAFRQVWLELGKWQTDTRSVVPEPGELFGKDFVITEDCRLRIDFEAAEPLEKLRITVENFDTRARITARADRATGERCVRTAPLALADGVYRVRLENEYDADTEPAFNCQLLPHFLISRGGMLTFAAALPPRPTRPLKPGETVTFALMEEYPQLLLPATAQFFGNTLRLPQENELQIRLPRSARAMTLEITIPAQPNLPGVLTVRSENRQTFDIPIASKTDTLIRIPVAAGQERILPLRFEFTPRLRRRAMLPAGRYVRIKSLRLD